MHAVGAEAEEEEEEARWFTIFLFRRRLLTESGPILSMYIHMKAARPLFVFKVRADALLVRTLEECMMAYQDKTRRIDCSRGLS